MRDAVEMPNVDGKLLNDLCNALDCTLNDLIQYIPDSKKFESFSPSNPKVTHKELIPKETVFAAAIGAAQAVGSTDPVIAAKVAASVMQILQALESGTENSSNIVQKY
jgi:Cro/C1-type HTH DNA-binding domain